MAALGRYIYTMFGAGSPDMDDQSEGSNSFIAEEQSDKTWTPCDADRYKPSIGDVLSVKEMFLKNGLLPPELVDPVIDFAEYWPHTTSTRKERITVRAGEDRENQFIVRSFPLGFIPDWDEHSGYQLLPQYQDKFQTLAPRPWSASRSVPQSATEEVLKGWEAKSLPRGKSPCRKIVFTIKSYDQGWGGTSDEDGPYAGSFTWFDVGKERLSAFREAALLEAWEMAPWPQVRLYVDGQNPFDEAVHQKASLANPAPLVCSLRTLLPETTVGPSADGSEAQYEFTHALNPMDGCLQRNITADDQILRTHKIVWSYDDNIDPESPEADEIEYRGRGKATANGEFVRNMKVGDTVTVWAKARYPGWVNNIDEVTIHVYWVV